MDVPRRIRGESRAKTTFFALRHDPRDRESDGSFHHGELALDVSLEKRYPVAAGVARAWQVLCDVHAVAHCMPGAELTEQVDATHFKGVVKVKVGPVTAQFGGELEVLSLDAATHTLRMRGKGADKSGSTASLDLTATLEPAGDDAATLVGAAQVILNGKLVQMAGRMIGPVSEAILAQFAQNFSTAAAAVPVASPALEPVAVGPIAAEPVTVEPVTVTPAPIAPARELNAMALLWGVLRNWLATLLGRRT
jgi:carbon monoxide dehydrogenase subunit G